MMPQRLPIYARYQSGYRSSDGSGVAGVRPGSLAASLTGQGLGVSTLAQPEAGASGRFLLQTLAGQSQTVWHLPSLSARKPLPVPVWRSGYKDGQAQKARFNKPTGLAVDRLGNVFVADSLNHCIRKISPRGRVSTLVGNGQRGQQDGSLSRARLNYPTSLAMRPDQHLFIVDQGNQNLRCLTPDGQLLSFGIPGRPLGGLALYGAFVYYLSEIRFRKSPQALLCRLDPSTGENALLCEWEGHLQWLPYREGDEDQPFSRWWHGRRFAPEPLPVAPAQQADGLGLAVNPRGVLHWLVGLHLYQLDLLAVRPQLQRVALQLNVWPLPRWQGLSVGAEGQILALDAQHHLLYQVESDGAVQALTQQALGGFLNPHSVTQDAYGRLFVTDTGHWRICRMLPKEQNLLLRLAKLAFLPYLPAPDPLVLPQTLKKGIFGLVQSFLKRSSEPPALSPAGPPALARQHALDVLQQGNRSQQLACVKEVLDHLKLPQASDNLLPLRPLLENMLQHPQVAVRTLLVRHICDTVHQERDALFWLELLEQHQEGNRLLKKYLVEVLAFLGRRFELYGHCVPLMIEYVKAPEEDVAEFVFGHLMRIREAGYDSLVDPLIEELSEKRKP